MRRGYFSREKEIIARSKLKKGKLKAKQLLKITILDEQGLSVKSEDRRKAL